MKEIGKKNDEKTAESKVKKQNTEFVVTRVFKGTKTLTDLLNKLAKSEIDKIKD